MNAGDCPYIKGISEASIGPSARVIREPDAFDVTSRPTGQTTATKRCSARHSVCAEDTAGLRRLPPGISLALDRVDAAPSGPHLDRCRMVVGEATRGALKLLVRTAAATE